MTSTISSRGALGTEAYIEEVRKETRRYQPWFTHLQWAQHMIAYGIVSLIFGLSPVFIEFPWFRAIIISPGLVYLLIGLKRYLLYSWKIIWTKFAPHLQRP